MPPKKTPGAITKKKPKAKSKENYQQHMVQDENLKTDCLMKRVNVDVMIPVNLYIPAEAERCGTHLYVHNGSLVARMLYEIPGKSGLFSTTQRLPVSANGVEQEENFCDYGGPVALGEVQQSPDAIKLVPNEAALDAVNGSR